jgi:hypothetical protein
MLDALLLSLMPVLVILACRTLCTLMPPPVPTYLQIDLTTHPLAFGGGKARP